MRALVETAAHFFEAVFLQLRTGARVLVVDGAFRSLLFSALDSLSTVRPTSPQGETKLGLKSEPFLVWKIRT